MKPKQIAAGILASAIGLGAGLLVSEVAIRIYSSRKLIYDLEMSRYAMDLKLVSPNPRIGHVHKPNATATLMGVPVEINSDGLRDREYPVARSAQRRIVFLGDSLTFGWGVEKPQTFEELLEAQISATVPTEILNFGTGNYNTEQEVALFLEKGPKYAPDEVVVFYFINDAEPTPRRSRWEALGHSRILSFFWSRIGAALARNVEGKQFREYYANLYAAGQPGWIAAQRAFRDLRDACDRQGTELRVVLLPDLHVLDEYPFAAQHRAVLDVLAAEGIKALDLAPRFAGERDPMRLWVALDDAHPNAVADALIAEYSREFILEGLFAPETHVGH